MSRVNLRTASMDDVEALLDLWSRAGENADRPPDRPASIRHLVEHDPEAIIVAALDGRVVGTIIAGWYGWRANLYRLAVHPDQRGRGLARRLVDAAEHRLRSLGAERFCAMVLDENEVRRRWWASAGYEPQGEWSRWVRPAGDRDETRS